MFTFLQLRHPDQSAAAVILTGLVIWLCYHTAGKHEITSPKPCSPKQYQFHIDINTATHGELQTITGIGPKLAESIIEYRDQYAPIRDSKEILNVRGIGEKRYGTMEPYFID